MLFKIIGHNVKRFGDPCKLYDDYVAVLEHFSSGNVYFGYKMEWRLINYAFKKIALEASGFHLHILCQCRSLLVLGKIDI